MLLGIIFLPEFWVIISNLGCAFSSLTFISLFFLHYRNKIIHFLQHLSISSYFLECLFHLYGFRCYRHPSLSKGHILQWDRIPVFVCQTVNHIPRKYSPVKVLPIELMKITSWHISLFWLELQMSHFQSSLPCYSSLKWKGKSALKLWLIHLEVILLELFKMP